jgi:hypothetical protein
MLDLKPSRKPALPGGMTFYCTNAVQDHRPGQGFDWGRYLEFDPERAFDPNGRGIALARSLAFASVTYIDNGNVVEATIALGGDRE